LDRAPERATVILNFEVGFPSLSDGGEKGREEMRMRMRTRMRMRMRER
jgi:hypothetical protein